MNNYVSTDVTTTLPANDLRYKNYVHTNVSSTVVWDAPGVNGVMMWIYDPASTIVEKYVVDPETQDLYADRSDVDWNSIILDGTPILVDGIYDWNIMTNNPVAIGYINQNVEPIYQQPEFVNIISKGEQFNSKRLRPMGNWKLVFPRCESFKLTNIHDGTTYKQYFALRELGYSSSILGQWVKLRVTYGNGSLSVVSLDDPTKTVTKSYNNNITSISLSTNATITEYRFRNLRVYNP
jgi:hypothetical protein